MPPGFAISAHNSTTKLIHRLNQKAKMNGKKPLSICTIWRKYYQLQRFFSNEWSKIEMNSAISRTNLSTRIVQTWAPTTTIWGSWIASDPTVLNTSWSLLITGISWSISLWRNTNNIATCDCRFKSFQLFSSPFVTWASVFTENRCLVNILQAQLPVQWLSSHLTVTTNEIV